MATRGQERTPERARKTVHQLTTAAARRHAARSGSAARSSSSARSSAVRSSSASRTARQLAQQLSGWSQLAASWHTAQRRANPWPPARQPSARQQRGSSFCSSLQLYTARQLAARQLAATQQLAHSPPHPRRSRAPRVGHSSLATRACCDVVALCPVSLPRASVLVPVLSTSHVLTLVISRSPVSE